MQPALDETYVLIVDDWNWSDVRDSTLCALVELGSEVLLSVEVRTSLDNSQPSTRFSVSDWHNGYFIAVVRKQR